MLQPFRFSRYRLAWACLAIPVAVSLTACETTGAKIVSLVKGDTSSLWGTEWRLEDLGGLRMIEGSKLSLAFPSANRASGNASCNTYSGSATLSGETIRFGQMAVTKMACGAEANEQEYLYLKALGTAQSYSVKDNTLLIQVSSLQKPLRFVRTKP